MNFKKLAKDVLPHHVLDKLRSFISIMKNARSRKSVFRSIYNQNSWNDPNSISGPGSNLVGAQKIRVALPSIIERNQIKSVLDIPCGDLFWIQDIFPANVVYTGADIVPELIKRNRKMISSFGNFQVLDLVKDSLPYADLALVRDCLIHLPNKLAIAALYNIKLAGIPYILTTTYESIIFNEDIEVGGYRPVNLKLPPFNLPEPIELISDTDNPSRNFKKSMGLWLTANFLIP